MDELKKHLLMKTALYIVALLVSGIGFSAQAQTTAVMQARVEVVSGAGFTSVEDAIIDLSTLALEQNNTVKAGAFSLVAAPGTDVNVSVINSNSLRNENGEAINLDSLSINQVSNDKGEHNISVNGLVKNSQNLKGHFQGQITAVVEYL